MILICTKYKDNQAFEKYIEAYGYHFNHDLAEQFAGSLGEDAILSAAEKALFKGTNYTEGDLIWLRAMYRSDFGYMTPEQIQKMCEATLHDKDGYEGMIFKRWLVDAENRNYVIPWEDYL